MKITKYPQSCVLIEAKDKRILVDPGELDFQAEFLVEDWTNIHLIFVTHKHKDHCNANAIKYLMDKGAVLFSTKEVQFAHPELKVHILKEGDVLNYAGIKVEVTKAVHGYTSDLKGKEIHEAVGYIFHDGDKKAYHAGDTISFPHEYKADAILIPVSDHGLVLGPYAAALFAKESGAQVALAMHTDNPKYPADLYAAKNEFEKHGVEFKVLGLRENITL